MNRSELCTHIKARQEVSELTVTVLCFKYSASCLFTHEGVGKHTGDTLIC